MLDKLGNLTLCLEDAQNNTMSGQTYGSSRYRKFGWK